MKKNNMIKIIYVLMAAAAIMCVAAVIGWVAAESEAEQTTTEPFETTPLVINTVERQDDIVLTVYRGEDEVFQYAGDIELWKAADGKAYGIIYLDEEVCQ